MASEPDDSFESIVNKRLVVVPRRKPAIATNAPKKVKQDSGSIDGKKIGTDSSTTPLESDQSANQMGRRIPAMRMQPTDEFYATVHTSAGTFITRVAPKLATRNWPKVKTLSTPDRNLKPKLVDYIDSLLLKYDGEIWITSTMELSEGLGRALIFCEEISGKGRKKEWRLDFAPLDQTHIEYEEIMVKDENGNSVPLKSGKIKMYHPFVRRGLEHIQLHIKPENGVIFRAEPDPYGNREEGIPQTLGVYNSIKRIENIQESTAKLYKRRGLGLLHISIEGADPDDCDEYAEEYGNPDEYTVMVTDERFKLENHAGITQGFDLSETIDTYKEGLSEGTGYPQSAFKGGSEGQMSTSESNSDTKETIIQTIQKRYQSSILKVLYMLDRKEKNKNLDKKQLFLVWEHTIKMDKQKEVNVKATIAGFVNSISTIYTVDMVHEEFGLPPHEDPEIGKMLYSEHKKIHEPAPMPFGGGGGDDPDNPDKSPNVPVPPKFKERTLKNQLNKKEDALVRMFKRGIKLNEAIRIQRSYSEDGKSINRTIANQLYQKVKKGEI